MASWFFPSIALFTSSGCEHFQGRPLQKDRIPVTATAYSSGASCNGPWGGENATGGRLKYGEITSAAADWSKFPLGTKFRVIETGRVYEVDDYGSAMVGRNKVDLFKNNYRDVYSWGVKNVTLEILQWGCRARSLEVLRPRARWGHVREMVDRLDDATKKS